ncbi:hypothetical protein [Amycolatopsis sp.]|uniref:hypothetical protein n=1 Tax=Amycolatopsis sp. TaxID=37632 RepID=UPI002D8060FD|nr:hypothetical protein [Amycolatopsis sp.]HET6706289.1 hypothetical protein [Amycolatopsis sp.]
MSATVQRPRRHTTRRVGYLVAAVVDVVLLVLINVEPGWQAAPVLTDAAAGVVVVVDISLAIALAVNLLCVFFARPWLARSGEVVSTAAGLAAVSTVLAVFPFRFGDPAVDWAAVVRGGLISVVAVVSIALVIQLVKLVLAVRFRRAHGRWE